MTYLPAPGTPLANFTNSLPEETRHAVLESATCREYRAGEIICPDGAPADALYFVLAGTIHLDFPQWRIRHVLKEGESFGESEAIRRVHNSFTAIAVTDVELWVLEKRALDALLEKHSALSFALWHRIAAKHQTMQASRRRAPQQHHAEYKVAFSVLAAFVLFAAFVSLGLVAFTATTLQVEGLELKTEVSEGDALTRQVPASPTKVAQWLDLPEPTRTLIPPTATRLHTRTATPKPLTTRTLRPQPTPTATVVTAVASAMPTPLPREWEMPTWTSVEGANVAPGQKYFRLVKAIYFDEASAGVLDENGKELSDMPVRMEWGAIEYAILGQDTS